MKLTFKSGSARDKKPVYNRSLFNYCFRQHFPVTEATVLFFKARSKREDPVLAELKKIGAAISAISKDLSDARAQLVTTERFNAALKEQGGLIIAMGAFAESKDKIFDIDFEGIKTRFFLPNGASDRTQTDIIRTSGFYQARPLRQIYRSKLINGASRVIDVGGNIGNHTLFFANVMGAAQVITFEPNPMVLPIIKRNIELNGLGNKVKLFEIGLGAKSTRGRNQLPTISHIGRNEVIEDDSGDIDIKRLDDLDLGRVDFIKIDVEGHGAGVLRGGWQLIGDHKPLILMEATSASEKEAVADLKRTFGYKELKTFGHDVLLKA